MAAPWGAIVAIAIEEVVLAASGGKCPLTVAAERLGAIDGSVNDIFLPRWFADRIFLICGTSFVIGCAFVAAASRRAVTRSPSSTDGAPPRVAVFPPRRLIVFAQARFTPCELGA